jgi:putative endopeptidase
MADRITLIFLFSLCSVLNGACSGPIGTRQTVTSVVDNSAIDSSINPCDDFYEYACGNWIKTMAIPEDRAQRSRSFSEIDEKNLHRLNQILSTYAEGQVAPAVPNAAKLGDFYAVCMDEQKAEAASMRTFLEWSARIRAIKEKKEIASLLAGLQMSGVNAFFSIGSEQDLKDPKMMIAALDQGGLGLPDREYYLSRNTKMRKIRSEYRDHIRRMMRLRGKTATKANHVAQTVLRVETALARDSMSLVERRSPEKIYHPMERAEVGRSSPSIVWNQYFDTLGYPGIRLVDLKTPGFFTGVSTIITKSSLEALRMYLDWHLLEASAPALGKAFVDEQFRFRARALSGQKALEPRWKRCVTATISGMGFALGRAFVADYYRESQKRVSEGMIESIERAFHSNLQKIAWMDETTRSHAIRKLGRVVNQIGYPERWRKYDELQVDRQSYLKNQLASEVFNTKYELDKIGKPTDRSDWDMPPEVVNAYYDPTMNKMVFPAAIFERPFFTSDVPALANFSGIGMVMGHELTHGFDDEGRKFDAEGRLRDWWTANVVKEFDERVKCVVQQYGAYRIPEGAYINGALTAGENIADMGGIKTAYVAWKRTEVLEPSMSEQRDFFIHFAQGWCTKTQPALALTLIQIDPHSPPRFRVNGPLANFDAFSEAFGCPGGSAMNPKRRCTVW